MTRRWTAAAAVAVAAGAVVLAGPAPAEAAACSGTSGVTVVVDFGSLGGIQVGCAAGTPASGLAALHAAGFTTTGTQKDGIKFVCRINGAPASDPCVLTPPASAYWSYWQASKGAWVYSGDGALDHHPHPGDVEGWAFGSGGRPGIAPPAAPKPSPRTTAPRPPAPPPGQPRPSTAGAPPPAAPGTGTGGGTGGGTGAGTGGGTTGGTAGGTAGDPARPGPGSPTAGTSGRPATTNAPTTQAGASTTAPTSGPAAGAPSTSDPGPPGSVATEPASSSSKTLGAFALAVALITALGLAGFLIARRRRATPS